ncbi:MAG: flagellar protein FlgN [Lachnospiraceae bacterium]|nr:flagellar protein FlgN [Lachnospiraceae bacterium]
MENLIDVLEKECSEYEGLLTLSQNKTPVIVSGDLENLQKITDEEQDVVIQVNRLEKKRDVCMNDIASVLNKDVQKMNLSSLITMMDNRPDEQRQLADVHDKLKNLTEQLKRANAQNEGLIENALELVQFDLNLLQAYRTAPETANYNKGAYNVGDSLGGNLNSGSFDAKQ